MPLLAVATQAACTHTSTGLADRAHTRRLVGGWRGAGGVAALHTGERTISPALPMSMRPIMSVGVWLTCASAGSVSAHGKPEDMPRPRPMVPSHRRHGWW